SADLVRRYFEDGCGPSQRVELRYPAAQAAPVPGDSRLLAIGLHNLELLGADGAPLTQVTFGTLQSDMLGGRGWYANEAWGQWAGDADGTAALCLAAPPGAATLSLTAHARQADVPLEVWVDGTERGSVTLQPTAAEYRIPLEVSA